MTRREPGRIRGAVSKRGARYAASFGLLGVAAGVAFFGSTIFFSNHIGWPHLTLAAAVFVPTLIAIAVFRVQADRDVVAERAWLARLPFAVPNYFEMLGTDPDLLRSTIWIRFWFVGAIDETARAALIELLGHDGATWSACEGEGERFERPSRPDRMEREHTEPLAGRKLCLWAHALFPRLHAFAAEHPFTKLSLGGS